MNERGASYVSIFLITVDKIQANSQKSTSSLQGVITVLI